MKPLVGAALLTLASLSTLAHAQDRGRQFRSLSLSDGRTFVAEILSTESTGLALLTPQGKSLLSFEVLLDMTPADQNAYESQPEWSVYLHVPQPDRANWKTAIDAMPGVNAIPPNGGGPITPGQAAAAKQCAAGDTACVARVLEQSDTWVWIIGATKGEDDTFAATSRLSSGHRRARADGIAADPASIFLGAHDLLELERPSRLPKSLGGGAVAGPPTASGGFSQARVTKLSFVPLPGMPSLAQNDGGNFAIALATVLPLTAGWVAITGANTDSAAEHIGLSVAGFYALTVTANQILGTQSSKKANKVSVAPGAVRGKGAGVVVGGRL